jgi:hypothetical protein
MVMHKALVQGAALRGEAVPSSLASFQIDNGGLIAMGAFFFNWVSGYMVNDSVRGRHTMIEMQRECNFAPGEMMLVEGHSFPIFSAITGTKAHWFLIDACNGILEDGWSSVEDALAVTRPSVLEGYETRGGEFPALRARVRLVALPSLHHHRAQHAHSTAGRGVPGPR